MAKRRTSWRKIWERLRSAREDSPDVEVETGTAHLAERKPSLNPISELMFWLGLTANRGWVPVLRLLVVLIGAAVALRVLMPGGLSVLMALIP